MRRWSPFCLGLLVAATLVGLPIGEAGAEEGTPSREVQPLPPLSDHPPEGPPMRLPQRLVSVALGFGGGVQPDPNLKQIYGTEYPWSARLCVTFLWGERFGVGVGFSLQLRQGVGVAPSEQEVPDTFLANVPVFVEGVMRLLVYRSQPVVPYLRGGLDAVVWSEHWHGPQEEERWIRGVKWGAHAAAGAQFRLPFVEISNPGGLIRNPVVSEIYFHVEGFARSADDFGESVLDLSTVGLSAGVTLLL